MALDTMSALDADGLPTTINKIKSGRAAAVDSQAVVISTEDLAAIAAVGTKLDSVISLVGATNTALAATNSALNTLDGRVDGLEGLLTTANAAFYAEDTVHTSGANGRVALGVRKDTAASLAGSDGDYTAATFDASGRQHVNVGTSALPTGAATEATLSLVASEETLANMATDIGLMRVAAQDTAPSGVVGYLASIDVTPTVEATPDYSSGDVIGGVMTFAAILRADAKTAYAVSVKVASKVAAASMAAMDVYIFNANPSGSTTTENGAFALADADRTKLKGKFQITEWGVVGAAASEAYVEGRIPITGAAADDLYVVMVARGTINLGSTSDLFVTLTVDQN